MFRDLKITTKMKDKRILQAITECYNSIRNPDEKERSYYSKAKPCKQIAKFLSEVSIENINWTVICDIFNLVKDISHGKQIVTLFLKYLLENNLYFGEYKERLVQVYLPLLERMSTPIPYLDQFYCYDNFRNTLVMTHKRKEHLRVGFLKSKVFSEPVWELIENFLLSDEFSSFNSEHGKVLFDYCHDFCNSFTSYKDFDNEVFWKVLHGIHANFSDDDALETDMLDGWIRFYRSLWDTFNQHDFNSSNQAMKISESLLFSHLFVKYIKKDYRIIWFDKTLDLGDCKNIVFIFKDVNKISSKGFKEEYHVFHLSGPPSHCGYREIVWKYFLSNPNASNITSNNIDMLWKILRRLYLHKSYKGEAEDKQKLFHVSNLEAAMIEDMIQRCDLSARNKNTKISSIKLFLQWAEANSFFTIDQNVMSILRLVPSDIPEEKVGISDEHLVKINHYLSEHMHDSVEDELTYCVFHLLLQEKIRYSELLNLQVDCLFETSKPGYYAIKSNVSKTSNGQPVIYGITKKTYKIIMQVIQCTEQIRSECTIKNIASYLFLTKTKNHGYRSYSACMFNRRLKKACSELELPQYTSKNLRKTHMTKAIDTMVANGHTALETSVVTGHTSITTTMNHYFDASISQAIQANYNTIITGDVVDACSLNIEDDIQEGHESPEYTVENGCGQCMNESCTGNSFTSCLVCEHFVTTLEHLKFFLREIEHIDSQIEHAKTQHDVEDLTIQKQIYLTYVDAMNKLAEKKGA